MQEEIKAAETAEQAPVSADKRHALVRYVAILFAVAFMLVFLSYLVQLRDSRDTISELNATSASALHNAERLQEDNRSLLNERDELRQALDEAADAQSELEKQLQVQTDLTQQAQASLEAARTANDLLLQALQAQQNKDKERFEQVMKELAEKTDDLTEAGQNLYEELKTGNTFRITLD